MDDKTLDIGNALTQGWRLYLKEIVPLTVQNLIVTLLGSITFCILMPVLSAGFLRSVMLSIREGRAPMIEDVFACFDRFGTLLWSFCMMLFFITIGFFLLVIPGIYLSVIWMYTFLVILDNPGISAFDAMKKSSEMVRANSFWSHFVALLVLTVIVSVVAVIPLAVLLAIPFALICLTLMYLQCRDVEAVAAREPAPPGGV